MASLEGGAGRLKVPVDQVAIAAYRTVFTRLGRVLELSWLPVLVLLAAELVPGLVSDYLWPEVASASDMSGPLDLAQSLVALLCLSGFAVRWHHLMLASDRQALPGRRFLAMWARFLGYTLPFYAVILAVAAALTATGLADAAETQGVAAAIVAIVMLALSLAFARCSLVFPATVIGRPLGYGAAWRRMRGNTWRFIATTLLVIAPLILCTVVLLDLIVVSAHLPIPDILTHPPLGLFLLDGVLDVVLAFLMVALGATILTDFYRRIMRG